MIYGEIIFLVIGIFIGIAIMLNRKEYTEQKSYEELDAELRKDLDFYKNLSSSLKNDLAYTKQQLKFERERNVRSSQKS